MKQNHSEVQVEGKYCWSRTLTQSLALSDVLYQRFPTFLTRGALFRINFYGGAPCLPYALQVNGV